MQLKQKQSCPGALTWRCRFELSVSALSINPQWLPGHLVTVKLYRDSPDLTESQPVLEATLDLKAEGPSTSDRMAGSPVDWQTGAAQVGHFLPNIHPAAKTC